MIPNLCRLMDLALLESCGSFCHVARDAAPRGEQSEDHEQRAGLQPQQGKKRSEISAILDLFFWRVGKIHGLPAIIWNFPQFRQNLERTCSNRQAGRNMTPLLVEAQFVQVNSPETRPLLSERGKERGRFLQAGRRYCSLPLRTAELLHRR